MQTTEQHIDAFWTPRGLTAYATSEDMHVAALAIRRERHAHRKYCAMTNDFGPGGVNLQRMLDAERADRFSYGPSLTTMVDYVTAQVHKETVAQAFAVAL